MAKKWSEVAASPEYQSLAPEQQDAARQQYFQQVVAPNVPAEHMSVARQQFDADTAAAPRPAVSPGSQTGIVAVGTPAAPVLSEDQQRAAGADPNAWRAPDGLDSRATASLTLPRTQREQGWKWHDAQAEYGPVAGTAKATKDALLEAAPHLARESAFNPAYAGLKGALNLGSGLAQLPGDIVDTAPTRALKEFGQGIPDLPAGTPANELGATLVQYGLPAAGALKLIAPIAKAAESLPVAGQIAAYLANMTGAGAADAAVTAPDHAATLGSLLGVGPTAIGPNDSDLTKRAKVGAETFAVAPALDGLLSAAKGVKNTIAPLTNRWTDSGRRALADADIVANTLNPQQAISNIDAGKALAGDGFQPDAASLSNDEGLIGLFRRLAGTPQVKAQVRGNEAALSGQLGGIAAPKSTPLPSPDFVGPMPAPDGEVAKAFYNSQREGMLGAAEQGVINAEGRLAAGQQDLTAAQAPVVARAGTKEDASAALDGVMREQSDKLMGQQRQLYAGTAGEGVAPTEPYHKAAQAILDDIGTLGDAAKDPKLAAIVRDVQKLAPAKSGGTMDAAASLEAGVPQGVVPEATGQVPVSDLVDLSTRLTRMVGDANANRLGGVSSNLTNLKGVVNGELERLAAAGDQQAAAAVAGRQFHANEVAPRFREGQGGDWSLAQAKGESVPPTATAGKFLPSNGQGGAREAVTQLDTILKGAPNEAAGRQAARDYIAGSLSDTMVGGKVDAPRLDKWLNDNGEALKLVPDLKTEVMQMRNRIANKSEQVGQLQKDVAAADEARKATGAAFADDPTAFWLDADPTKAVEHALGGKNPAAAMNQLVAAARKDPSGQALTSLRNTVREHLNLDLRNTGREVKTGNDTGALAPEDLPGSLAKANKMLADGSPTRKALEQVLPSEDLAALDLYRKRFAVMDRRNVQGLSGSQTHEFSSSKDAGNLLGDVARIASPMEAPWWTRLAKGLEKHTIGDVEQMIERMKVEALSNPDAARAILSAAQPGAEAATARHLNLYLGNNVLGAQPRDNKRKEK